MIEKRDKKERRKQNQITLESFTSKGCALLGFRVLVFYPSVCHTISQNTEMGRHVVSSCWEHPELLLESRDARGSAHCNPLVTSWRPPARPCWPWHPRKPRQSPLFLSHPHLSVLVWGRGFGVVFLVHNIWVLHTLSVWQIMSLFGHWVLFYSPASAENNTARQGNRAKIGYLRVQRPSGRMGNCLPEMR